MHPEVLQHVEDGLEPEVLHAALAVLVQGEAEVLQEAEEPKRINQQNQIQASHQIQTRS